MTWRFTLHFSNSGITFLEPRLDRCDVAVLSAANDKYLSDQPNVATTTPCCRHQGEHRGTGNRARTNSGRLRVRTLYSESSAQEKDVGRRESENCCGAKGEMGEIEQSKHLYSNQAEIEKDKRQGTGQAIGQCQNPVGKGQGGRQEIVIGRSAYERQSSSE